METLPSPPFLGLDERRGPPPRVAVIPLPYEGTVTWGRGAADGPRSLLEASIQVELYDEVLDTQISSLVGIRTLPAPRMPRDPEAAIATAQRAVEEALDAGRWPVVIGGEHSLSLGVYRALAAREPGLGVIQLDAHADLRESYEDTPYSHASVMARIREHSDAVLQLGIRSLSRAEALQVRARSHALGFMHEIRGGGFSVGEALDALPESVFVTLDVDALDLSLVRATGTPEPGGFTWDEINSLLARIFRRKRVVGVDVMELCGGDRISAFCAARLVHRMIGLRFAEEVDHEA